MPKCTQVLLICVTHISSLVTGCKKSTLVDIIEASILYIYGIVGDKIDHESEQSLVYK